MMQRISKVQTVSSFPNAYDKNISGNRMGISGLNYGENWIRGKCVFLSQKQKLNVMVCVNSEIGSQVT